MSPVPAVAAAIWLTVAGAAGFLVMPVLLGAAVVDLNLPDGEGFDLVPSLQCPVIIMSALSGPQNRLRGVELGAVDFIPKPFLLQELFIKIERLKGDFGERHRRWESQVAW